MKRMIAMLAAGVLPLGVAAFAASDERTPEPVMERGTVRAIKLPEAPYELPPGKGRETVTAQCAVCHTLAYIPIQPPLSREVWTAEVTKMQKTFSAPIPDDKVAEIIDYLVAVNGPPGK
jgi:mono/diheme cytochrome c family protein